MFNPKDNNIELFILIITIAVTTMGFCILAPLIPSMFFDDNGVFSMSSHNKEIIYYSVSFAIWPAGLFLGTPLLGMLSDYLGRKKLLVVSLVFTGISYLITVVSILFSSIWLFLFSRFICGFFGGSFDIAQACVADISTPETKPRNMGLISFATSLGVVLGPILAGFTTDNKIFFLFNIDTPFVISVVLCFAVAGLIIIFFNETLIPPKKISLKHRIYLVFSVFTSVKKSFPSRKNKNLKILNLFTSFLYVFKDKKLFYLTLAFMSIWFASGVYGTAVPVLLKHFFNAKIEMFDIFYLLSGIGNVIAVLFIMKPVMKWLSLKKCAIVFSLLEVISFVILISFDNLLLIEFAIAVIATISQLIIYCSILAMCSNTVTVKEQGRLMGALGAVVSLSLFFSGLLDSVIILFDIQFPLILTLFLYLVCILSLLKANYTPRNAE